MGRWDPINGKIILIYCHESVYIYIYMQLESYRLTNKQKEKRKPGEAKQKVEEMEGKTYN